MSETFKPDNILEFPKKAGEKEVNSKNIESESQTTEEKDDLNETRKELRNFFAEIAGTIETASTSENWSTEDRLEAIGEVIDKLKNKKFSDEEIQVLAEPYQGFDEAESFYKNTFDILGMMEQLRGEDKVDEAESMSDEIERWKQIITIWKDGLDTKTSIYKNKKDREERSKARKETQDWLSER
ncbi:MAG: hypothetical protein GF349_04385 [Candidatus Magasanikbacteria bacterium]|nr:hypothetical protein [Candidatus Magasanikbacteria bacterium]